MLTIASAVLLHFYFLELGEVYQNIIFGSDLCGDLLLQQHVCFVA
jgi:hypothetical protein